MAGKGANTAWRHDRVHVDFVVVAIPCVMFMIEVVVVLLVNRSMSTYRVLYALLAPDTIYD